MANIERQHLERTAYVYVRQSTMAQVYNHVESQRRQYALADHARELGWQEVRVLDDLGRSGGGHVERRGFDELMNAVCQGQVGAVFAVEASRLARNGHEWHRLLEFSGIVDTLIVDHDGIYDPKHPNDRLLLGLKGTMSEMEVSMFRQRSQEAIAQMARRGEFYPRLSEGYVLQEDKSLVRDPDEHVQQTIELVFEKFRQLGSMRQVNIWFCHEGIQVPYRRGKTRPIEFVECTEGAIARILKDPFYAGAYAFGRTEQQVTIEDGRKRVRRQRVSGPEAWTVLIHDHHEPYISWKQYLKHQALITENHNGAGEAVRGSARRGKGLLAGLVRCGHCSRKMQVRYRDKYNKSEYVSYLCYGKVAFPGEKLVCSHFGGVTVEQAVVAAVLDAISSLRVEALLEARERIADKHKEKRQQLELERERAIYEANRCERQYNAVEPENRLVARNLERHWNEALDRVGEQERKLSALAASPECITKGDEEKLRQLAFHLPRLWDHEECPLDLKKRLLRAVIKEIVVYVNETDYRVLVHWHGGQHTEMNLRKRKAGYNRWKTPQNTTDLVRHLAKLMCDRHMASQLNIMKVKTSKGYTWTRARVANFRTIHSIPLYSPEERQSRGELTIEEAAARLKVSYSTVERMIKQKQLPAEHPCPGAPWIIKSENVQSLANGAEGLKKGRPSSPSPGQKILGF